MKNLVIISRKWHHPKISMVVTDEELSFAIDLDDFISALQQEMNGDGIYNMKVASDTVVKGIKGESVRIM